MDCFDPCEMASSTIRFGSDALYICGPCKTYSKTGKDAVIYCPDCKDYLCADCKVYHEKLSTRQHWTRAVGLQSLSVRPTSALSTSVDATSTGVDERTYPAPVISPPVLSKRFDVSLDTDTEACDVTDILLLENVIIVLDQSNNTMKVFDRKHYSCKYSVNIDNPYSVVQVKHDELVATNSDRKSVHIFTFSEKSASIKKKFSTELPCYWLCHSMDQNLLYIICTVTGVTSHVAVYTLDGKLTRKIEPLLPDSEVLNELTGIAIHHIDKRIYVTDHYKGLVILSPFGKFESVVYPKELNGARSPVIDRAGHVYFLGLGSDNLFVLPSGGRDATVLPPSGRDARVLISKGIPTPECIFLDGKHLAVVCRLTNLVKIFKFN